MEMLTQSVNNKPAAACSHNDYVNSGNTPMCPVMISGQEDSNLRPPAPKAGALPGCAMPRLNGV